MVEHKKTEAAWQWRVTYSCGHIYRQLNCPSGPILCPYHDNLRMTSPKRIERVDDNG